MWKSKTIKPLKENIEAAFMALGKHKGKDIVLHPYVGPWENSGTHVHKKTCTVLFIDHCL